MKLPKGIGGTLLGAIHNGDLAKVEKCLRKGASANARLDTGASALWLAIRYDYLKIAEVLIANGAEVNEKDAINETPLHWVAYKPYAHDGFDRLAELLIAKGANVNAKGGLYRSTPLIDAATQGHSIIAQILITNGADINAKDSNGYNALYWATIKHHESVMKLLKERGAR